MIAIGGKVRVTAGPWNGRTGLVTDLSEVGVRDAAGKAKPCLHRVDFDTPDDESGPFQWITDGELVEV